MKKYQTYQIYLSGMVQKHFGIASKNIQPDSDLEPPLGWHSRWRFEYVIASSDGSQHLFLATNEASLYSYLLPLGDGNSFEELVSLFYRHWVDSLAGMGVPVNTKLSHETRFLRGRPNKLIGSMNQLVYHTTIYATEYGDDIKSMHKKIRHMPMKKDKDYVFPDQEFERLVISEPPYSDQGMALTEFENAMVEVAMEAFVEKHRPPEKVRDQVDLSFRIEDQSVLIFELRPGFRKPGKIIEEMVAKTTFVRKAKTWEVYWQRSDRMWHSYQPVAEVRSLEEFLKVVEEDQHGCFWG